jgi:polyisoprenoid-binding protein YceI
MLMLRKTLLAVASSLALAVPALAGDTYVVDKTHSEVSFQVRHMMVSKVRGVFTDFGGTINYDKAKPESSSVEISIKTASINTNNEKRDAHLRSEDFFFAEKFPEITFKSTKIVSKGDNKYDVSGDFTMRGVTKQITLPVTLVGEQKGMGGETRIGFETGITLNRKDYGLAWNRALETGGVVVGDEVVITINIEAVKQAPKTN